jgi:oxygen-independent coproporphyrinogen-3 oxidase
MKTLGIYIHIPFCVRKCKYCDFISFPVIDAQMHRLYAEKLAGEISCRSNAYGGLTVDSIFFGGGTPSLPEPQTLDLILEAVYSRFRVTDDAELTIEANPCTLSREKLSDYRSIGINRLSLGAQSFRREKLEMLGRLHNAADTYNMYEAARAVGFDNINLDLIFGLPCEKMADWMGDLQAAMSLFPEHISFYSLQLEAGTPLFEELNSGELKPLDDELDRLMYHYAIEEFEKAGYCHYEISNAARQGFESRHNLKDWSLEDYLGVGLGAHSYLGGVRYANTESFTDYICGEARCAVLWSHKNSEADKISEYVFLGLRKTEGIDLERFKQLFGRSFWDIYAHETEGLIRRGLLELSGRTLKLTRLGLDLSNQVFSEYVQANDYCNGDI